MLDARKSAGAEAAAPREGWALAIAFVLLLPLYLAPLVVAPLLPGLDLPFHLSIVDFLSKSARPDSPYAAFYRAVPSFAPYGAYYLAVWAAAKACSVLLAHKIVVGLYVAAMPLTLGSLLAACGRSRIPALLGFPLAYNLALHYGFLSFATSLPVLFLLLAQLVRFLTVPGPEEIAWKGLSAGRWFLTSLLAAWLLLCHLQNFLFGLCAGLVFVVLIDARITRRLWGAAAFLPAVGALVLWHRHGWLAGGSADRRNSPLYAYKALIWARRADREGAPWLLDIGRRLLALPEQVLRGFTDGIDILACWTLLFVAMFYVAMGVAGRWIRSDEEESSARLTVATWAVFLGALAAYLLLPHHMIEFDIVTFAARFAPLALALFLLVVPGELSRYPGVTRWLLPLPAFVFCALYGRELVTHYRAYTDEIADFRAVAARAVPGKRALGLPYDRQSRVLRIESALVGLANLYPVLAPAAQSMTALPYCGMRHIPCRPLPGAPSLDPSPWSPGQFDPKRAIDQFDYFFVRSPPLLLDVFGEVGESVELVAHEGTWWLYRKIAATAP